MTTIPRLYLDAPLTAGASAPLSGPQTHYLKNVLRHGEGDAVRVFNARDGEFEAAIDTLGKKGGAVKLGAKLRAPEPEPDLWLLFAPVKRAAIDLIAQKATELGAARLQPVVTERTIAARVNEERLQAIAVEAAEQCGRLAPPAIVPPQKLSKVLDDWPKERRLVYCDEAGDDPALEWGGREGRARPMLDALGGGAEVGSWAILIGPEGGFTAGERARLRGLDFVTPVTLGPRILRADTAVFAALALWQAALGDFRRA
jgi:16S rRNA (uracil1498-N3)-methyltransferase